MHGSRSKIRRWRRVRSVHRGPGETRWPGPTNVCPPSGPAVADSVFGAVVEEMAARFAADRLVAADAPAHGLQAAPAGIADGNGHEGKPLDGDGAVEPGVQLALTLNREA